MGALLACNGAIWVLLGLGWKLPNPKPRIQAVRSGYCSFLKQSPFVKRLNTWCGNCWVGKHPSYNQVISCSLYDTSYRQHKFIMSLVSVSQDGVKTSGIHGVCAMELNNFPFGTIWSKHGLGFRFQVLRVGILSLYAFLLVS